MVDIKRIHELSLQASIDTAAFFVMDKTAWGEAQRVPPSALDTRYVEVAGDTMTGALILQSDVTVEGVNGIDIGAAGADSDLITADGGAAVFKWDDGEDAFSANKGLRITSGNTGFGIATPIATVHVQNDSGTPMRLRREQSGSRNAFVLEQNDTTNGNSLDIRYSTTTTGAGAAEFQELAFIRFIAVEHDHATRTGGISLRTSVSGTVADRILIDTQGEVAINSTFASAQLHVDQSSGTGAKPVLLLDQGDVSEEMMELTCTIGVGNAIEAVGAKTLTTTHFVKVTITGVGARYFEVGTIA